MPIYEYQCAACGQRQEFLQKVSDPPRTRCEHCGENSLSKMVTAAGFQLKGSGWYVTDFRNSGAKPAGSKDGGGGAGAAKGGAEPAGQSASAKPADSTSATPAAPASPGSASPASGA